MHLLDLSYESDCRVLSAAHGRNDSIVNYTFSKALKRMMPASHLHIVQGVLRAQLCFHTLYLLYLNHGIEKRNSVATARQIHYVL